MIALRSNTLIAITLCASLIAGCAQIKPPLAELDDAARRIEAARTAGGATYAPMELRMAQDKLGQARAMLREEDYSQAAEFADEAQVAGDFALAKTRLGKARENVDARSRDNAQLRSDLSVPTEPGQGGAP